MAPLSQTQLRPLNSLLAAGTSRQDSTVRQETENFANDSRVKQNRLLGAFVVRHSITAISEMQRKINNAVSCAPVIIPAEFIPDPMPY